MPKTNIRELSGILAESQWLPQLDVLKKNKKSRLFGTAVRSLTPNEMLYLKAQGNRAEQWDDILVAPKFMPDFIENTTFIGPCVLGVMDGRPVEIEKGIRHPSGIYRATLIRAEVGNHTLIHNAGQIADLVIRDHVIILNTGSITASAGNSFGNGQTSMLHSDDHVSEIQMITDWPPSQLPEIAAAYADPNMKLLFESMVKEYIKACTLSFGVINDGVDIRNVPKVKDAFIGEGALIDGITLVENSTILSSEKKKTEISHGAFVRDSIVQTGCLVTTGAIVDRSMLPSSSTVEHHAVISNRVLLA